MHGSMRMNRVNDEHSGGGMSMVDDGKSRVSMQTKDQNSEGSLVKAFQKNLEDETPTIFVVCKIRLFPAQS